MTQRRIEGEALSCAWIQPTDNGVSLSLGVARQVRPISQLSTQQAIDILVGPALPGIIRIGKNDLDREPMGQLFMFRHLVASVIGHRFAQRIRHGPQHLHAPIGPRRIYFPARNLSTHPPTAGTCQ